VNAVWFDIWVHWGRLAAGSKVSISDFIGSQKEGSRGGFLKPKVGFQPGQIFVVLRRQKQGNGTYILNKNPVRSIFQNSLNAQYFLSLLFEK